MARSTGTDVLLGCLGLSLVTGVLMCGGSVVLLVAAMIVGPGLAMSYVVDDQPLPIASEAFDPSVAAAITARICPALASGAEVTVTGEEATQLLSSILPPDLDDPAVIRLDVDPEGDIVFDLSVNLAEGSAKAQYLNVHSRFGFTLEHGWFTAARIDALKVGSLDASSYLVGQDATAQFNQQLAEQRVKNPDTAQLIDRFATLRTVPGGITLSQSPGAPFALCEGVVSAQVDPPTDEVAAP